MHAYLIYSLYNYYICCYYICKHQQYFHARWDKVQGMKRECSNHYCLHVYVNLALRIEQFASLTAESSSDDRKNFEKWECSDRMSLMMIKCGIPEAFRGAVSDEIILAKYFLAEIEKHFAKNDKAETSTHLANLIFFEV